MTVAQLGLVPGEFLGHFEILSELRAGGMATLYIGRRRGAAGFSRLVAIKVVHPHLAKDEAFVRMFIDEAKLASRIEHPSVVHVEELGRVGETFFLVMEYVHGCTLSELLAAISKSHRRMRPEIAVWIAIQVARGLDAAHEATDEQGRSLEVVHRDVSPQNVLVSSEGHIKLIDFGVAKASNRVSYTAPGALKGKIRYMPPEQLMGEVDRRSDIYALGLVLWEMLTGRRRFVGDDIVLLDEVRNPQHPGPRQMGVDITPELDAIVLRCLSAAPEGRPATARDLARLLLQACPEAAQIDARDVAELMQHFVKEALEERSRALPASLSGVNQISQITTPDVVRVQELTVSNSSAFEAQPVSGTGAQRQTPLRSWLWALGAGLGIGAVLAGGYLAFTLSRAPSLERATTIVPTGSPATPVAAPTTPSALELSDDSTLDTPIDDDLAAGGEEPPVADAPVADAPATPMRRVRRPRASPADDEDTLLLPPAVPASTVAAMPARPARMWMGEDGIIDSFD